MFTSIKVIMPLDAHSVISERLEHALESALNNVKHETLTGENAPYTIENSKILFVISLDETGINDALSQLIRGMRNKTIRFERWYC